MPKRSPVLKNEDLLAALKSHNWNMQLATQPPRSPFLNICDLSFNWSLQCKAESIKYHCDSLEDMKNLVESEFNSYDVGLLKSQRGTLAHMYKLVMMSCTQVPKSMLLTILTRQLTLT